MTTTNAAPIGQHVRAADVVLDIDTDGLAAYQASLEARDSNRMNTPERAIDMEARNAALDAAIDEYRSTDLDAPARAAGSVAPTPVASASAPSAYLKTILGTLDIVGVVGASKQIVTKTVGTAKGPRTVTEFSIAYRAPGAAKGDAPTWYKASLWNATPAQLELVRQGTWVEAKGRAVQSTRTSDGKSYFDVRVEVLVAGPAKGSKMLSSQAAPAVAGSRPGYLARVFGALFGR